MCIPWLCQCTLCVEELRLYKLKLTQYVTIINAICCSLLTHSPTHSPTHSHTHPPTHSPTHSHTHPPTHPPTHSLTHPLTHPPTYSHSGYVRYPKAYTTMTPCVGILTSLSKSFRRTFRKSSARDMTITMTSREVVRMHCPRAPLSLS